MKHKTRKGYESEYIKTIGIKLEKMKVIDETRGRKSKAGKLDEIIEFYLKEKKLEHLIKHNKN